jgi:hypothetical protein
MRRLRLWRLGLDRDRPARNNVVEQCIIVAAREGVVRTVCHVV